MKTKLEALKRRHTELTAEMARPEVVADYSRLQELNRERTRLDEIVALYATLQEAERQRDGALELRDSDDLEMRALAADELRSLEERIAGLEQQVRMALLPRDPRDERDVIVEVRAAVGGEEAALWAADLARMYTRYAERHGWQVDVLSAAPSEGGGFKEIIVEVCGRGAYSRLKFESGPHRVQRVPVTEAQGRLHTSIATVAVLPEAQEVEVGIEEKDLRVDIFHSGGAGGQNVNKVATAVRITHLPTGIVVVCQDERSQLKNRQKAMQVLRSRLYETEQRKLQEEVDQTRRQQVGSGERAEKIRTYNFPQDRVTDRRIGLTVHNLEGVLDGDLDTIIDALVLDAQARQLQGVGV